MLQFLWQVLIVFVFYIARVLIIMYYLVVYYEKLKQGIYWLSEIKYRLIQAHFAFFAIFQGFFSCFSGSTFKI